MSLFSPGNVTFPPAFQIALVGISDLGFSSRSDLQYIPTLRTILLYKYVFYLRVGSQGPCSTYRRKKVRFISWIFPGSCGDFSENARIFSRNSGDFPQRFAGVSGKNPSTSKGLIDNMRSIFLCSRCYGDGGLSCSDLPRCQD